VGRRKAQPTVPVPIKTTRVRKPKSQVQKNRDIGKDFEAYMMQYFDQYLKKRDIKGIVYRYPDGKTFDQVIDVLIDSSDFLYAGLECKSIKNSLENNGKLYFSKLGTVSKRNGLHQFINQHRFLYKGSRFGLMAFKFRDMKKIFIVPHQIVYEELINGFLYITTEKIITNGFDLDDEKASLKLFIRDNCKTLDD